MLLFYPTRFLLLNFKYIVLYYTHSTDSYYKRNLHIYAKAVIDRN
ncbi:MAG: hypothetical protein ACI83D_000713 [Planctomycetota bacterium]|jgi:hypothetical protein